MVSRVIFLGVPGEAGDEAAGGRLCSSAIT